MLGVFVITLIYYEQQTQKCAYNIDQQLSYHIVFVSSGI
jgi:hypothetical protein